MADVYKQSFKQNYTNNIELSIFNCGLERCALARDHQMDQVVIPDTGPPGLARGTALQTTVEDG